MNTVWMVAWVAACSARSVPPPPATAAQARASLDQAGVTLSGIVVFYGPEVDEHGERRGLHLGDSLQQRGAGWETDSAPCCWPAPDNVRFGSGVSLEQMRLIALLALEAGLDLREISVEPNEVSSHYARFMYEGVSQARSWTVQDVLAAPLVRRGSAAAIAKYRSPKALEAQCVNSCRS